MKTGAALLAVAGLIFGLTACETNDYGYKVVVAKNPDGRHDRGEVHYPEAHHRHGPPPHAPAHGYRYKYERDNVDLVYDQGLGVYVVVGHTGLYYQDGFYFRYAGDNWEMSVGIGERAHWQSAPSRSVPPGLAKRHGHDDHPGKGNGKGKGKGRSKESHARSH